ncbi:type VI secretion system tip protein TssI/VgrG [Robbsia sp. KACC 23696]|uniref:type VI secretion system Vgr family protein n=1 Tax=Robbsia sp. KACC 23696 TaxID=3149231 RepID=UPI00325BBDEB
MPDAENRTDFTASLRIEGVDQVLVLDTLDGEEGVSRLYAFSIAFTVSGEPLDVTTMITRPLSITMRFAGQRDRFVRGIVSEIVEGDARTAPGNDHDIVHCYTASVVPKIALLTFDSDRSIYQGQRLPEIMGSLFREHDIAFEDCLTKTYPVRDYCVRYDESAYAFIARLMAEAGIFFCFDMAAEPPRLILADVPSYALPGSTTQVLRYVRRPAEHMAFDTMWARRMAQTAVPRQVIVNDYQPTTSASLLLAQAGNTAAWGARYVYPGGHDDVGDGAQRAQRRLEAAGVPRATLSGTTCCHALTAWSRMALKGDGVDANKPGDSDYRVLTVRHQIQDGRYQARFSAMPVDCPFRPEPIDRPRIAGSQTGVVVGPAGETVWVDDAGRIKVRLHWDRTSAADEHASCWIRIAQATAGQGWGHWVLPRIGQEVLVNYVEGDPDRPVVTATLYNDVHTPPLTLPREQTQTVLRSRTFGAGASDGNALVFDDKADAQLLALHASRAMQIDVTNAMSTTIADGDETHRVSKGNRVFEIAEGDDTQTVQGKRTETVNGDHAVHDGSAYRHLVSGDYTLRIDGNFTIEVGGNIGIKAAGALSNEAGTALTNKAGTTLSNEGLSISSKASATQTVDGGGMLTLKGGLVSIN